MGTGFFYARAIVKRVLLVAPQTNLIAVDTEIQEVVNSGLTVRLLRTNATEDELADLLVNGGYQVLWFATHTAEIDGEIKIMLSDDQTMTANTLTQMVRGTGLEMLYLNTCSSLGIAQAIQDEIDLPIIATVTEVPDTLAYRTGWLYARRLAQIGDYRAAFEASKPGRNRTYVFLDSYRRARREMQEIERLLKLVIEKIDLLLEAGQKPVVADDAVSYRYMVVILISAIVISVAIVFLAMRLGN